MTLSSSDLSLPESRNMSVMRAVKTFVMEPILKPVPPPGGPLPGSGECKTVHNFDDVRIFFHKTEISCILWY